MTELSHDELSPALGDDVKTTTCYMCACRCGIKVHLQNGKIRYIAGNRNHPVNKGVLCAKGAAGIMHHYSPARLQKPLRRVGERGAGEFEEIEWDEALDIATDWLGKCRARDPKSLAFFTGRDQSQALTGWWAGKFGTPNYAAHGGFCSVNMATAGMYSIGASFWEFSEPDWERSRYFIMFGVAEDHSSNPIKVGLSKLKQNGGKFVSVNPIQTGYSAVANEWLGVTPGSDGLLVLSLAHELLRTGKVDVHYLADYTDAPHLVIDNPGGADDGLLHRDTEGTPVYWDRDRDSLRSAADKDGAPALKGRFDLGDGRHAVPVFERLARRYLAPEYAPENVAEATGIAASTIRRIAREIAHAAFEEQIELDIPWTDAWGRHHDKTIGRPVSMHAMRGISAHANGFQTCRAIHLLQILLGSIDVPGGLRYKPPYPKSMGCLPQPCADSTDEGVLRGAHLGYPCTPDDLLVDADGTPQRIDKAFSWEAPLAAHGMMHTVIANAWAGDPYPIDTLFMYMANMAWNSSMNTAQTIEMLTDKCEQSGEYRIPRIIYADAFYSETVAYADLILPDTTYLERWDAISLLDRPISDADAVADSVRRPVLAPDRDVRPFQDVLLDLGARLGLSGMVDDTGQPQFPGGYPDYIANHERAPGVGTLAGWRGADGSKRGIGEPNPDQLKHYVANDCFWRHELTPGQQFYRNVNRDYLAWARQMGFRKTTQPILLNLYAEPLQHFRLAGLGHGDTLPPLVHRERVARFFDPLPFWYAPNGEEDESEYPLHAVTQRPMAMYHSWGGQNAWLRQLHGDNKLYVAEATAAQLDVRDGEWVWVVSPHARIKAPVKIMLGVNPNTVWTWNAIGKRKGAWNLDTGASESNKGFLLNHLIADLLPAQRDGYRYSNSDPISGQAAWYDLRVRIEKLSAGDRAGPEPEFAAIKPLPGGARHAPVLAYDTKGPRR